VYGSLNGGEISTSATPTVTVTDTTSTAPSLTTFGVSSSVAGVRFTGLCFYSSTLSIGSSFTVDPTSGALRTSSSGSGLNYETQRMYGIEVQIVDNPATNTGTASYNLPASLKDFSVVKVSVVDVNEAPFWATNVLATCSPPASTNTYGSTTLATLSTTTLFAGCFYVPESTASSTTFSSQLLSLASDPDTLWSTSNTVSQTLVYSLLSSNNVFSGSSIFGVNSDSRVLSVVTGGTSLNFETQRTYLLTAQVSDAATSPSSFPSLSATASVAIYVTDVNEPPVIAAQVCRVEEQTRYNNCSSWYNCLLQWCKWSSDC
jgi:hypothetical protein